MIVLRFNRHLLALPQKFEEYLTKEAKKTKLDAVNECVMKVYFKKKYLIVKGKTAVGALKNIFHLLATYSGNKKSNVAEDNLYKHFVEYFWTETRGFTFRIRVLLATSNHFDLLKREQKELMDANFDQNCLNNSAHAYIPIYREETGSHGWLNTGSVLSFLKWKQKMRPQPEPENYETSAQIDNHSPW